jgi:hypothetical protein
LGGKNPTASQWAGLNRALRGGDNYGGLDGGGDCPQCVTDKSRYNYRNSLTFEGYTYARVFGFTEDGNHLLNQAAQRYFGSTIGIATRTKIISSGRVLDILEQDPSIAKGNGRFDLGLGIRNSYQVHLDANLITTGKSFKAIDGTNQCCHTVDSALAHEIGHAVYGGGVDRAGEIDTIRKYENPYRLEMGYILRALDY